MARRAISKFIETSFSKHLFATNMVLGSGFMFCGDMVAQRVFRRGEEHDWDRSKNMYVMGTGFGVLGHFWYKFLDNKFPGKSWANIRKKLMCECAATPAFAAYTFFSFGALQGRSVRECSEELGKNFHLICMADWCGYVPVQFINFYYLPPKYRFLCVCSMSVVYDVFLAWILNRESTTSLPEKSKAGEPSTEESS